MDVKFYQTYFKTEEKHWLMVVRRAIITDLLHQYFPSHNAPGRQVDVLDFGTGSGILVNELNKKGFYARGVDINEDAVAYGKSLGFKNLSVYKDKLGFPENSFDCVLALDVLEHVEDEKALLDQWTRVLKPGGIILLTVPAYRFLWGLQDELSKHYRRYTLRSLKKVLTKQKELLQIRNTYFNTFLFIPIALVRLMNRVLGIYRKSDFLLNNRILNFLFFHIFNAERKLLRYVNYPFGVSILVVMRKTG